MIRSIHPFPARMAPEIAMAKLSEFAPDSLVLDPMAGSGTVLRHAAELGHRALGFDMDPLAVLMAKVFTTPVNNMHIELLLAIVKDEVLMAHDDDMYLPWIDDDEETKKFINFWFAIQQKTDLRRIAYTLAKLEMTFTTAEMLAAADVLRLALSRIIITKSKGASLARDVSHSRPHKVAETSTFEVMPAFERSVRQMCSLFDSTPPTGKAEVHLGDARLLELVDNNSVDAVLTSPPYLNAIDYLRGHRLSLVWLGHRLSSLRLIRSNSIGAERAPDIKQSSAVLNDIQKAMCVSSHLLPRHSSMVSRYAEDAYRLMSEVRRVLKPGGHAVLVIGNSCLKGNFIRNSDGFVCAGDLVGLHVSEKIERDLPPHKRYLPIPTSKASPLGARMRTETVISFISS